MIASKPRKNNSSPLIKSSSPPARVKMSKFARHISMGLQESLEYVRGGGHVKTTVIEISTPAPKYNAKDVITVRTKLGLSQKRFAKLMNVSTTSIEGWESGLRKPGPATRRLIQILSDPKLINHAAQLHGLKVVKSTSKMR